MEEKTSIAELYFPQKLKLSKEIIKGLGKTELMQTVFLTLFFNSLNAFLYVIQRDIFWATTYFFISAAISYGLLAKIDDSNTSFVNQLKYLLQRLQSPSRYRYHYLDEWGIKDNEN